MAALKIAEVFLTMVVSVVGKNADTEKYQKILKIMAFERC